MRRICFTWPLLFCLLLGACTSKGEQNDPRPGPVPTQADELVIVSGSRSVTVTSPVVIHNSLELLRAAEPAVPDPQEFPLRLIYRTGESRQEVGLLRGLACIAPNTYLQGPSLNSLVELAEGQLLAPSLLAERVRSAERVTLMARDRAYRGDLSPAQRNRILVHLQEASRANVEVPVYGAAYPSISLEVVGETSEELRLITADVLETDHAAYAVPNGLWEEVLSWLPPDAAKPGDLTYLFQADQLQMALRLSAPDSAWLQDVHLDGRTHPGRLRRIQAVVRTIVTAIPAPKPAGDPIGQIDFQVNGQQEQVVLGHEWLQYGGQTYSLPGLVVLLRQLLAAG